MFSLPYNNIISFDGGLSQYPYANFSKSILHINPNMWKDKKYFLVEDFNEKETIDLMNCYIGLRRSNLKNVSEMIENGYRDTCNNRQVLDELLVRKS